MLFTFQEFYSIMTGMELKYKRKHEKYTTHVYKGLMENDSDDDRLICLAGNFSSCRDKEHSQGFFNFNNKLYILF